jgi:hypothetical protein
LFGEAEVVTQSLIIATLVLINQKRIDHYFSTTIDSKRAVYLDPSIIKEINGTEKRKVVEFWLRSG